MALLQVWWSFTFIAAIIYSMEAVASLSSSNGNSQPLFFGLLGNQDNRLAKRGVEDALDDINNRSDILSGYNVKVLSTQTLLQSKDECSRETALKELFGQVFNSSHRMTAVLDLGCSVATEATAEISHFYNIIQLSCLSSSYKLSNGEMFPYYFQLLPSEVNLAHVFYSIIKEYGWRRVALIVQNEQRYKSTMRRLKELLSALYENEDRYIEKIFDSEDSVDESIIDTNARVYVIATDAKHARELMCLAYRQGLKYPQYVFLMYGTYEPQWWAKQEDKGSVRCGADELAEVLEFSLAALHFPSESIPENISGEMESDRVKMFQNMVDKRRKPTFSYYTDIEFYHQCYDATIALAIALDRTIQELQVNGTLNREAKEQAGLQNEMFEITDFDYSVNVVTDLMKKHIEETNFRGVSGPVHFDENGIRDITNLRVLQFRANYINGTLFAVEDNENDSFSITLDKKLRQVEVAYISENGTNLTFINGNIWPRQTPYDGLPKKEIATIIVPVTVIFVLLDGCGILFALICLAFNILFRRKKLIRLSSPNLNYLLIIGTLMMYCSGIAFLIPTVNLSAVIGLCFIRMWLLIFGYSCGFGTIVAKLWRVYYIFRNPQAIKRKSGIQDWHLALFVLALLILGTVVMFLHIILEGTVTHFKARKVSSKEKTSDQQGDLGIRTDYSIYQCSSEPWLRNSIIAVIYSCLGFLHICALYFAFQTRKVKVKGLNDAKYIAMTAYITTIVLLATLVTSFALSNYINIYAVVNCLGAWLGATVILGFMFIPKMVRLYRDPEGENVFTAHDEAMQVTGALGGAPQAHSQVGENDIESSQVHLKKKIENLEEIVTEYKRMTSLDITKRWMTLSNSVTVQNGESTTKDINNKSRLGRQISKVSFELGHTNPLKDCSSVEVTTVK